MNKLGKKDLISGTFVLFALLGSVLTAHSADKPFMKTPIEVTAERSVLVDPETGFKDLQFLVSVTNTHFLIDLGEMELNLMVFGEYDGRPNVNLRDRRHAKVLSRMLLNQKATFSLPHRKTLNFKSQLMKSGEGKPGHINHGVWYQGFLVVIKDKNGEIVTSKSSERKWLDQYREIEDVATDKDFRTRNNLRLR